MAYTKTQEAALDFADGRATAQDVLAALQPAKSDDGGGSYNPRSYDSVMSRMQTDDVRDQNLDGWDGVVSIYNQGLLTDEQFKELLTLAAAKRKG